MGKRRERWRSPLLTEQQTIVVIVGRSNAAPQSSLLLSVEFRAPRWLISTLETIEARVPRLILCANSKISVLAS